MALIFWMRVPSPFGLAGSFVDRRPPGGVLEEADAFDFPLGRQIKPVAEMEL